MDEYIVFELSVEDGFTVEVLELAKANRETLSERVYNIVGQPTTTSSKGIKLKKSRKYLVK